MTTEMVGMDEFDVLLNDVLRTVANPELPERVRVQTRVWVREMGSEVREPMSQKRDPSTSPGQAIGHPASRLRRRYFAGGLRRGCCAM